MMLRLAIKNILGKFLNVQLCNVRATTQPVIIIDINLWE